MVAGARGVRTARPIARADRPWDLTWDTGAPMRARLIPVSGRTWSAWGAILVALGLATGIGALTAGAASAQVPPPPSTSPSVPGTNTTSPTLPPLPPCSATLSSDVLFAFDSSQLTAQGETALRQFVSAHNLASSRRRGILIKVVGHTDSIGTAQYNLDLSLRRAETVRRLFVALHIASRRVQATGVGSSQPAVSPELNAADQKANRRVVIQLLKANGQPDCEGAL